MIENNINQILNQCNTLSSNDKDMLAAIFNELSNEQKATFDNLKNIVLKEYDFTIEEKIQEFNITTAIVDVDKLNNISSCFHPVIELSNYVVSEKINISGESLKNFNENEVFRLGVSFLFCSYELKQDFLEKTYQAKITYDNQTYYASYSLHDNKEFIAQEEIVEKTALKYNVKTPVIYSPMSRRAIKIWLDVTDFDFDVDAINIDLQLELNGLNKILLLNKCLVWNVQLTYKENLPSLRDNTNYNLTNVFDTTFQIYEFNIEKNEFIHVINKNCDARIIDDKVYLALDKNVDINELDYIKLTIFNTSNNPNFKNHINPELKFNSLYITENNYEFKKRIFSLADIEYVLNKFEDVSYSKITQTLNDNDINMYKSVDNYHYPKSFKIRNANKCYIKFDYDEFDKFFCDKINFILAYMNYYYPEFYFVGVK